jgi:hypothetical protein
MGGSSFQSPQRKQNKQQGSLQRCLSRFTPYFIGQLKIAEANQA